MKKFFNRISIMLILITMLMGTLLPTYAKKSVIEYSVDENGKNYLIVSETGDYVWNSSYGSEKVLYREINGNISYVESKKEVYSGGVGMATAVTQYKVFLIRGVKYLYDNPNLQIIYRDDKTLLSGLENMVSNFVYHIANGLHTLVGKALGESVTIDDLVFNKYSETNITFFKDKSEVGENASTLIYGYDNIAGLNSVINSWYSIFTKIAIMGYMVILVYMGIRIMFASTAEKKANYKKLFIDWIVGISILLLFPYAMKYIINLNEICVETIEANKGYDDKVSSPLKDVDYDKSLLDISIDEEIDWTMGTDYMSLIANAAWQTERIALSLAFLIMTWQLIALIFHYYKRLFMIAFLIIIFPLVALSYAIDKIADGKSQAFDTWLKEFILNVFVQTFHAIVYVFVCTTVYSASGVHSSTGYDFILIIVGVTFLFKGEEIIRQIFGQVSKAGTMNSLSQSAAATFAKFKIAEKMIKGAADYTVGEKSVANKLSRGAREIGALNARRRAFDSTAKTPQEYNIGARLEHAPEKPEKTASREEKQKYKEELKLFNAAAVFNNPNSHSYQEKARALRILTEKAKEDPNHEVFKDTNATVGQILEYEKLDNDVQRMMTSGYKKVDIEREVTARIGYIFANESDEKIKDKARTYYTSLFLNGAHGTVSKLGIRRDVYDIRDESNHIQNSINFGVDESTLTDDERDARNQYKKDVLDGADILYRKYESRGSNSDKKGLDEFSKRIAILNSSNSGVYTRKEILDAAKYIRSHASDSDAIIDMLENEFGYDADIFMHSLARKINDTATPDELGDADVQDALKELRNYEDDPCDGYFEDQISPHQVIKCKDDNAELDNIIEDIYKKKKNVMSTAVSSMAKDYLAENEVDIMKGSQDTTLRTQGGYTEEELLAMKIDSIGKTLSNLAAINKGSASEDSGAVGVMGWVMKEYLARKEEQRTGISRSIEESKSQRSWLKTTNDVIKEHKANREKIDRAHFLGDIGDRKDK